MNGDSRTFIFRDNQSSNSVAKGRNKKKIVYVKKFGSSKTVGPEETLKNPTPIVVKWMKKWV